MTDSEKAIWDKAVDAFNDELFKEYCNNSCECVCRECPFDVIAERLKENKNG